MKRETGEKINFWMAWIKVLVAVCVCIHTVWEHLPVKIEDKNDTLD